MLKIAEFKDNLLRSPMQVLYPPKRALSEEITPFKFLKIELANVLLKK